MAVAKVHIKKGLEVRSRLAVADSDLDSAQFLGLDVASTSVADITTALTTAGLWLAGDVLSGVVGTTEFLHTRGGDLISHVIVDA